MSRTRRRVDPYHLIFKDGFWYLVGFCHWRGEERLFRVDRIRHIHILNEKFTQAPDSYQKPHMATAWGMELGEEFEFKVRFWGDSARFVKETQFHPHQTIESNLDESVIFAARACGMKPVARWILAFGGEAEVLEPLELRELVVKELRAGSERY